MGVVAAVVGAIAGKKSNDAAKKEYKRQAALTADAEEKAQLAEDEALRAQAGESTLGSGSNSKNVYASLLGGK